MPLLGFGVYQNYNATPSVIEAFRAGYRHVDSAQAYKNEADVGAAFRASGLKRADVFLTSKCVSKTHGYDSTLKGVDESLSNFGVDYLDLFLIHDPFSGTERRLATYKALQECKQAGKLHTVGVSNYGVKHLEEIRAAGFDMPAVNQIEASLHPFCQQKEIVMYCNENDIVVQAYCPLVRGRMDDPKGYVPLPKSATAERIRSNANLYDFELTAEEISTLDSLDRGKDGAVSWNPVDAP
ncbi:Aldo/keto reductase [Guyanagaster necrorhizus]|uniref:Aldo/keto reductase n=1 Tax=Guyanagaster necrorhizus TaxID=856835 RepID=A0A9P7VTP0_9AGAR|nr:Aldo/keto reductase [Guyanagaster necrorhizus MCA 3950]KAG7446250.1 Aldo/keto reductase [Guyanagaster necrorhizus MCA 3950]